MKLAITLFIPYTIVMVFYVAGHPPGIGSTALESFIRTILGIVWILWLLIMLIVSFRSDEA